MCQLQKINKQRPFELNHLPDDDHLSFKIANISNTTSVANIENTVNTANTANIAKDK